MGIKNNMKQAFMELKHDIPLPTEEKVPVKTMDARDVTIVTAAPTINTPAVSHVTTTVISEETILWGNLSSDGNVELKGALKGSIHTKGNVVISGGRILGNITGCGIQLLNARVQGNIMATGRIAMDMDSEVMGDIKAENISIDGHVKGDLKIEKSTNLLANALLIGNVDTRIISMSEGARVLGTIAVDQNNASATVFSEVEI